MRVEIDNGPLTEQDMKRAQMLGQTKGGDAHDNFLKGILVHMDVTAPFYWWKEAQRYQMLYGELEDVIIGKNSDFSGDKIKEIDYLENEI